MLKKNDLLKQMLLKANALNIVQAVEFLNLFRAP